MLPTPHFPTTGDANPRVRLAAPGLAATPGPTHLENRCVLPVGIALLPALLFSACGRTPEVPTSDGKKADGQVCSAPGECASGTCNSSYLCGAPVAARCPGLAASCGPTGKGDCCASLLVTGGTFYRNYDGIGFTDMSFPATVADFYLDKYEVTVGRFRRFVDAGKGVHENPPTPGSGAHPLIAGSGWDSAWNWSLSLDTDELKAAITCDAKYQTWTDTAGSNESRPMNCLDWYTAAAFCAWDGGRLPTEAEWNYAAAGGSEQREYPWGSGIDVSKASYYGGSGCTGNGRPDCALTDLIVVGSKPAGNGRWGQSDLAGNVWEWTLDWYASPYPTPCDNCANLTPSYERTLRGGYFHNDAEDLRAAYRNGSWTDGSLAIGARCARDSML